MDRCTVCAIPNPEMKAACMVNSKPKFEDICKDCAEWVQNIFKETAGIHLPIVS